MVKAPYVYIMASQRNGTLYIGVTSSLAQRAWQHKSGAIDGFSKDNDTKMLVYYEAHETMEAAIVREKHIKAWKRLWKIRIIEEMNPDWEDLYERLNQ